MDKDSVAVTIIVAVLSSAVINSLMNIIWSAHVRRQDIKREAERETQTIGHFYLSIINELEKFSQECVISIRKIDEGIEEFRLHHDSSPLQGVPNQKFLFNPIVDWLKIPVLYADKVKRIASRFEYCNTWIVNQYGNAVEYDEAFELEQERLAFYGLQACRLADEIRLKIKSASEDLHSVREALNIVIDGRRAFFNADRNRNIVIPELQSQFRAEVSTKAGVKDWLKRILRIGPRDI